MDRQLNWHETCEWSNRQWKVRQNHSELKNKRRVEINKKYRLLRWHFCHRRKRVQFFCLTRIHRLPSAVIPKRDNISHFITYRIEGQNMLLLCKQWKECKLFSAIKIWLFFLSHKHTTAFFNQSKEEDKQTAIHISSPHHHHHPVQVSAETHSLRRQYWWLSFCSPPNYRHNLSFSPPPRASSPKMRQTDGQIGENGRDGGAGEQLTLGMGCTVVASRSTRWTDRDM